MPPKKTKPHWPKVVEVWFLFYKHPDRFGEDPTFRGAQIKALETLYIIIRKKNEAQSREWTEDVACRSFERFFAIAYADPWHRLHFSLSNMACKFDELINKPKDGQPNTKKVTAEQLNDSFNKFYSGK